MSLRLVCFLPLALLFSLKADSSWSVARAGNMEVYSQRGAQDASAILAWLEQLRSLVKDRLGLELPSDRPVSVFGFQSNSEYAPYRLRATSDAYYVATDSHDYIVLPMLGTKSLATAAHEYAHLVSHAAGGHLPPWLGEGLADVFSTVRFTRSGPQLGGEPFERLLVLRNRRWLSLQTLLSLPADSPLRNTHAVSDIFYAQSWALTEMLLMSPAYSPRFLQLAMALSKSPAAPSPNADSAELLEHTYGKPLAGIARDLEVWVRHHRSKPMPLGPPREANRPPIETAELQDTAAQIKLAGMLFALGDFGAAEAVYLQAAAHAPDNPSVLGGLAAIALKNGRADEARDLFARALAGGLADADLCYRYADLLDRAGRPVGERRAALARAVTLQPGFDEARYALALLEKNRGDNEAALADLSAMRSVPPARAYHYWLAMADVLIGLGRNQEAVTAARKAAELASDSDDRAHAAQLAYMAQTHMAVRFVRDGSGALKLVTTRTPNDGAEFNPFIEPTDDLRRVEGRLREIDCSDRVTRMVVDTDAGRLIVAIPDPSHVQMRNAPPEFVCGPQPLAAVTIQYAASKASPDSDGIVRGVNFR
jgi:tetratricopeptide (TPR) repeat protein